MCFAAHPLAAKTTFPQMLPGMVRTSNHVHCFASEYHNCGGVLHFYTNTFCILKSPQNFTSISSFTEANYDVAIVNPTTQLTSGYNTTCPYTNLTTITAEDGMPGNGLVWHKYHGQRSLSFQQRDIPITQQVYNNVYSTALKPNHYAGA
jgi:hypothetical protein